MYSSAKKLQRVLTSKEIRKTFIDFFINNHEHKFVRSSPVVPFCDPTVAFVNAGMNQFKSVFLGKTQPPHSKVTNSQKCVRVGGKHNDLSIVGQDGYHHTFFEMLGNWSFGDYFKKEACSMALELIKGPYNIDPSRLYVTYFAGDKILGLPADLECFEIWRSLGFPSSRILPFGCKENFWEMGLTGPCGPCTEIHIDHCPHLGNVEERSKLVNAGLPELTELWNLVFIQYNREEDGSISQLPAKHVDTGMGFERLTAILQNKSSNYDTDLFVPIFNTIQKVSKAPHYGGTFGSSNSLDTDYRILADHARMITICLSDGMLPDQNQKLRRVLRKALTISENTFRNELLLNHLVPVIVDTLGCAYPEIACKQNDVQELIAHEQEIYKNLRLSSSRAFTEMLSEFPSLELTDLMECPGFVPAYRELQTIKSTFKNNTIPGEFLYKLTDTYGLSEQHFEKFAQLVEMSCDLNGYQDQLSNTKLKSKSLFLNDINDDTRRLLNRIDECLNKLTIKLPPTNNVHKYEYYYNDETKLYTVPTLKTKTLAILYNDVSVQEVVCAAAYLSDAKDLINIITEASNFYYESGGQQSDKGVMVIRNYETGQDYELPVVHARLVNNCVVHTCKLQLDMPKFNLAVGDAVELKVDELHRCANICHHTATHLLNAAIRTLFRKVTYQVSSAVTSECSKLEVGLIGKRITKEDVADLENLVNKAIASSTSLNCQLCNASDILQENDVTMVPGEIYPETGLRLVSVKCSNLELHSKELCCGTHVRNTKELQHFCITNLKQTNRARFAFTAVAGERAEMVLKLAALLKNRIDMLEKEFENNENTNATESELQKIRHNLLHMDVQQQLPYIFKIDTLDRLNNILRKLKETSRTSIKEFVVEEMKNVLQEKTPATHPYILHYISSAALMEEAPLQKATKLCTDRPILVISVSDSIVKARCCVPKNFQSEMFTAEKWLKSFATAFKAQVAAPKGQDAQSVCNMKGKKISAHFEDELEKAMQIANNYAATNMQQ